MPTRFVYVWNHFKLFLLDLNEMVLIWIAIAYNISYFIVFRLSGLIPVSRNNRLYEWCMQCSAWEIEIENDEDLFSTQSTLDFRRWLQGKFWWIWRDPKQGLAKLMEMR